MDLEVLSKWTREQLEDEARRRGVANVRSLSRDALVDALAKPRTDPPSGEARTGFSIGTAKALLSRVVDRVRHALPRREERDSLSMTRRDASSNPPPAPVEPKSDDHVVASPSGPLSVRVSWDVSAHSVARARSLFGEKRPLTARAVVVSRDPEAIVASRILERSTVDARGEWLLENLPASARVTAAIGVKLDDRFVSVAHSPVVKLGA